MALVKRKVKIFILGPTGEKLEGKEIQFLPDRFFGGTEGADGITIPAVRTTVVLDNESKGEVDLYTIDTGGGIVYSCRMPDGDAFDFIFEPGDLSDIDLETLRQTAVIANNPIDEVSALLTSIINPIVANYVPLTQKAAADGVATLDGTGKIPDDQIPDSIARDVEVDISGIAVNAAAILVLEGLVDDNSGQLGDHTNAIAANSGLIAANAVAIGNLQGSVSDIIDDIANNANAIAVLQMAGPYILVSQKNVNNGVAGLDGSGLVPDNRIPASIARDSEVPAVLSDLSDVAVTAPTDGQALLWNNGTGEWEPGDAGGGADHSGVTLNHYFKSDADGGVEEGLVSDDGTRVRVTLGNQTTSFDIWGTDLYYGPALRFLYASGALGFRIGTDYLATRAYMAGGPGAALHIGGDVGVIGKLQVQSYAYETTGTAVVVATVGPAVTGLAVQMAAAQSANAIEVRNSIAAVLFKVDPNGGIDAGSLQISGAAVSYGAADSGGAGFKVLRVPN